MRGLNEQQQSTIIGIVARVPVELARKTFLTRLEAALPAKGRVTDETLLAAIDGTLKSFKPGQWEGDEQGVRPAAVDCQHMTLAELAVVYQRILKPPTWSWPPKPPPTEQELKAKAADAAKFAALSQEQKAEAYGRSLFSSDEEWQQHKAAEEARRQAEETADTTPWPIQSPQTTQVIRGEAVKDEPESRDGFPTMADMRAMADRPLDEDARATEALRVQLERERLLRRRLQGKPRVYFR